MRDVLRVLIVDDERLARRALRSALVEREAVEVVGEAGSVDEAIACIHGEMPDVVFLDIQMRGETGFDVLDRIEVPVRVIFVTAYDAHAVRAFEVNALDYLLKPVDPQRLAEALRRVRTTETALPQQRTKGSDEGFRYDDVFFYEEGRCPRFIRIAEIVCIEAAGNYTELHLTDVAAVLTSTTLVAWEERLPPAHFVRIHRSTIVNLEHVIRIDQAQNYTYDVFVTGRETPLAMSRRRAKALKHRLG